MNRRKAWKIHLSDRTYRKSWYAVDVKMAKMAKMVLEPAMMRRRHLTPAEVPMGEWAWESHFSGLWNTGERRVIDAVFAAIYHAHLEGHFELEIHLRPATYSKLADEIDRLERGEYEEYAVTGAEHYILPSSWRRNTFMEYEVKMTSANEVTSGAFRTPIRWSDDA